MKREGINYKKVSLAANRLKKCGVEPSVVNVCEEMGLHTTTPELSALLEKWYHNQPEFKRQQNSPLLDNIRVGMMAGEKRSELEKSLSLVRATLESTADGIMMVNGQGAIVDWNQKFVDMWRIPTHLMEAGPENLSFDYILSQLAYPEKLISDVEFLYKNPEWQGELPELIFKDKRIFERFTQPVSIGQEIVGRVYSFRDVTEKRMAHEELHIRNLAIEASTNGVAIVDISQEHQPIIYVNKAFNNITDFTDDEMLGETFSSIYADSVDSADKKRIELAIKERREETVELKLKRNNNQPFWCELGIAPVKNSLDQVKHFVFILNDITQRKELEQQLLKQATHDALTELPNRVLLMDRVEQAMIHAKKHHQKLAFMFIDLDRFKLTNDTLGHGMGDKLLQAIANKLLIATSDLHTVARFGGDEFVVLVPELDDYDDALALADSILKEINKPIKIRQHRLKVTASIGISCYPRDGKDFETLMKSADLSMYYAKDSGRNNYQVFENEMNKKVINHAKIESGLQQALDKKEFYLLYQPFIDLNEKKVIGNEALIRWNNPKLGQVTPFEFIPIAEENDLIIDIGYWVLKKACQQACIWHDMGYQDLTMAVNISGRQLHQANLTEQVKEIIDMTGMNPQLLELEITESLLIDNIDSAIQLMNDIRKLGVRFSIDDFGTGYSSLSYLKQFPINKLKIDRSFVKEIGLDKNDEAIVKAIINLAHSMKLDVLAEGVETDEQANFINLNGCDKAQGYLYSPPGKPEIIQDLIRKLKLRK